RADHDRAIHQHLHDDVGDRGPQGRLSAFGAGGAGAAVGDRAGKSFRRHYTRGCAGADLFDLLPARRDSHGAGAVSVGRAYGVPRVVLANCSRIRDRLADGFDLGISRDHQPFPDPALVVVGSVVPAVGRLDLDQVVDVDQSADVWGGGAANFAVSVERFTV